MRVAVMVDTNAGITENQGKAMGVFVMPMPVIIDGKTYYEGTTISRDEFYKLQAAGHDITTSQPSPGDLIDAWENIFKSGYDEIVYMPMTSGLSNSYATAKMLAEDYDGKVEVADHHRISLLTLSAAEDAVKLVREGKTAAQIREYLEATGLDASVYITVDTLKYLKKGGRVTPAAAAIGNVLNIKPVLSIQGYKLDAYAKARGEKKAKKMVIEAIRHDLETRFKDFDQSKVHVGTAGTLLTVQEVEEWRMELESAFPEYGPVRYLDLGCSIATHTGPGARGAGIYVSL